MDIEARQNYYPDRWKTLFPSGREKGDHHSSRKMYDEMFKKRGFAYRRFINRRFALQGYVLAPF